MLIVNNHLLDHLPNDHPFLKVYDACSKYIKKHESFTFDHLAHMVIPAVPGEPESRPEFPQPQSFPSTLQYNTSEGTWEVGWAQNTKQLAENKVTPNDRYIEVGRKTLQTSVDAELIFWQIFVSKWIDPKSISDKNMHKYLNRNRKPPVYRIYDEQLEATREIHDEIMATKAREYILGSKQLKEEQLRGLAAAIGVVSADTKTYEQIQASLNRLLFAKVKNKYNTELISEFIALIETKNEDLSKSLEFSELAQAALDKKVIKKFSPDQKEIKRKAAYLVDKDGSRIEHVCDLVPGKREIQQISEALYNDPKLVESVKSGLA